MIETIDLALRVVSDSFEIYTINPLIKKKIHYVQSFTWSTAQRKQNKQKILLLY